VTVLRTSRCSIYDCFIAAKTKLASQTVEPVTRRFQSGPHAGMEVAVLGMPSDRAAATLDSELLAPAK
jgi:hypothetical protein